MIGLAAASACCAAPDSAGVEFFEKKIRPIFVENCYKCHSKEAEKLKGGLLLDTRDGVLKGGDTGPAIVPGQPDKSEMMPWRRILFRVSAGAGRNSMPKPPMKPVIAPIQAMSWIIPHPRG